MSRFDEEVPVYLEAILKENEARARVQTRAEGGLGFRV